MARHTVTLLFLALTFSQVCWALDEPLDFQAEHAIEGAMNHRLAQFLTTGDEIEPGRFNLAAGLGWGSAASSAFDLDGGMISLAAARGLAGGGGLELTGFFDRFDLSGAGGTQELDLKWTNEVPLEFPQLADTRNPQGQVTHWGAGLAWVTAVHGKHRRRWRFGLLYSRVQVDSFTIEYRLQSAREISGLIDYSASYDYVWPWFDIEANWNLGSRWKMVPHAAFFFPAPQTGFIARMTGPGFDVSGDTDTASGIAHMGDAHPALGLRFDHRSSGLSVDVGATVYNLIAEPVDHPGVDQAITLQIVWRSGGQEGRR
jgi:hypothetical protein